MAVITLTGPSCAGKSTIEAELRSLGCGRVISHTTRPMRAGEVNGEHYHFVTPLVFERMLNNGDFIEVVEFGGNGYAVAAPSMIAATKGAKHTVVVVEPNGALQIHRFCRQQGLKSFAVWVDCSVEEQARRWVSRLAADLMSGKGTVGVNAGRLAMMMTEEQGWRAAQARTNGLHAHGLYREFDFCIDNSSCANPAGMAALLLDGINERTA
jgi:guanylate kinase